MTGVGRAAGGDGGPGRRAGRLRSVGPAVLALAAAVLAAAACSGNPPARSSPAAGEGGEVDRSAAAAFDRAVAARERGEVGRATAGLRSVWRRCGSRPLGAQAFLLLAATRLDPRFRSGPPDSAAAEAASVLSDGGGPPWLRSAAESLYLVARDLGGSLGASAPPPSEAGDEAAGADCAARWDGAAGGAGALPALPGRSVRERLRSLQVRVDSLRSEVERLRELLEGSPPR